MGDTDGSARAVAVEVSTAASSQLDDQAGEQLDLLPPTRFEALSAGAGDLAAAIRRDRAGRPPGSKNLRTREAVEFIKRIYGDPLIVRARWASHTPETLARELHCTALEAFDRLERINADLCTFMHPRMAPIDGAGNPVTPHFTMTIGGSGSTAAPDRPPWEYMEYQEVSTSAPDVSHNGVSHGDAK